MSHVLRRAGALTLGVALSLVLALPAGASGPIPSNDPIYGRVPTGRNSSWTHDGACPRRYIDGDPANPKLEEANQLYDFARTEAGGGAEEIGLNVCWQNSSGHGGNEIDRGTFTIEDGRGTVSGTVAGGVIWTPEEYRFVLTVTRGTGSFRRSTGTISLAGCTAGPPGNLVFRVEPYDASSPNPLPKQCQ